MIVSNLTPKYLLLDTANYKIFLTKFFIDSFEKLSKNKLTIIFSAGFKLDFDLQDILQDNQKFALIKIGGYNKGYVTDSISDSFEEVYIKYNRDFVFLSGLGIDRIPTYLIPPKLVDLYQIFNLIQLLKNNLLYNNQKVEIPSLTDIQISTNLYLKDEFVISKIDYSGFHVIAITPEFSLVEKPIFDFANDTIQLTLLLQNKKDNSTYTKLYSIPKVKTILIDIDKYTLYFVDNDTIAIKTFSDIEERNLLYDLYQKIIAEDITTTYYPTSFLLFSDLLNFFEKVYCFQPFVCELNNQLHIFDNNCLLLDVKFINDYTNIQITYRDLKQIQSISFAIENIESAIVYKIFYGDKDTKIKTIERISKTTKETLNLSLTNLSQLREAIIQTLAILKKV